MGLFDYKIGDLAVAWLLIFVIVIVLVYHALGIEGEIYNVMMCISTGVIASVFTYYMMELKSTQSKVHDLHIDTKARSSPTNGTH